MTTTGRTFHFARPRQLRAGGTSDWPLRSIDHATLSKFRRKHPRQLRELYRQVVQLAIHLGVAKLAEVRIDGTRVLANANRSKTLKAEKVEQLLAELDRPDESYDGLIPPRKKTASLPARRRSTP